MIVPRSTLSILFIIIAAATLSSCNEECDSDQMLTNHFCLATADDCADTVVDVPRDVMCTEPVSGFGQNCVLHTDCPCATDTCAVSPGACSGFCSKQSCLDDPAACPTGWHCADLSQYVAGFSMCLQD